MRYFTIGHRLPKFLSRPLFGDRDKYGSIIDKDDLDWIEWKKQYLNFYYQTQKRDAGKRVNDAGYEIMRKIDLEGTRVLEIGPGDIQHLRFWKGRPSHFTLVDAQEEMLKRSKARLDKINVLNESALISLDKTLPFESATFDVILSFYSFEHLCPLAPIMNELVRILRPNGVVAGAIPAEGGLAWGLGRFMTSRRWLKRNTSIQSDKIVCWEHPNFAENILSVLDAVFEREYLSYWPLALPLMDLNLVIRFLYRKRNEKGKNAYLESAC